MHVNLDPQLVDKIANEVKSQGVFDQFRKDSMADVDTKPAYQNLRQRVENTVNKYLSEQKWAPDLNKNQLRERLRKHITEAGFLDVGVERIVDQVVNPKIATVFQPKIEDIAYNYLGIPKPQRVTTIDGPSLNGILQIETDLMPTDLEQVSPDSDKGTSKSDSKEDIEADEKMDDFESPPFEPIEVNSFRDVKSENKENHDEEKSGMIVRESAENLMKTETSVLIKEESLPDEPDEKVKAHNISSIKLEEEAEAISCDVTQESQLSQVSSDSRLSIVTNDNTQDEQSSAREIKEENNVNISEEAQMPKFNENSNSSSDKKTSEPLHFDIKKDEIKFEGTERKTEIPTEAMSPNTSDEQRLDSSLENKIVDNSQTSDIPLPSHEYSFEKENDFKFSKIEVKVELEEATKTTSLDDSVDRELHIIEKSEMSQCSMSQHSIKSPMVKQEKVPKSPSATSSPSQPPQKSSHRDKEHSSSSSRHKKHSKDRRSDKDREKHSSSSHRQPSSSSSSKYHYSSKSSSGHKVSGTSSDHHHHHHRSSSSSVHKSKHSSRNGKSSRSHHDSKDSRSSDHTKSRSDKPRDKSSKEKSERSKVSDDHYSSKHKWRKSTDSNDDEDSSRETSRAGGGPKDNSSSRDNGTNGTLNNSNGSSGTSATNNPSEPANMDSTNLASQKIVILDNLLENPKTNFIEIGDAHIQVNSTSESAASCSYDGKSLYYFENDQKTKHDVNNRIELLTINMDQIRKVLQTNLNFPRKLSTTDSEGNASNETERNHIRPESISPTRCAMKRRIESPTTPPSITSATLTIDCIQYGNTTNAHCLGKRFKFNGTSVTKVSPTPSELSVNSKENEFVDKNTQSDSESSGYPDNTKSDANRTGAGKRKAVANRNQRYSSEDLYKPRPILSQRSRRRGLDAVI